MLIVKYWSYLYLGHRSLRPYYYEALPVPRHRCGGIDDLRGYLSGGGAYRRIFVIFANMICLRGDGEGKREQELELL